MKKQRAKKPVKKKTAAGKKPAIKKKEDTTSKYASFFEQVFDVVRLIPKGRVTSYGAIAKALGTGGSSRMVGYAMNSSHGARPPVPAQRVVNRNGLLTGKHHFGTGKEMQRLLEKDGVKIKNDQIIDFKKLFWDPMVEIGRD